MEVEEGREVRKVGTEGNYGREVRTVHKEGKHGRYVRKRSTEGKYGRANGREKGSMEGKYLREALQTTHRLDPAVILKLLKSLLPTESYPKRLRS